MKQKVNNPIYRLPEWTWTSNQENCSPKVNFEKFLFVLLGWLHVKVKKKKEINKKKNNATRKPILYIKMSFLVELFFLVYLFFLSDFYMKRPIVYHGWRQIYIRNICCVCGFFLRMVNEANKEFFCLPASSYIISNSSIVTSSYSSAATYEKHVTWGGFM